MSIDYNEILLEAIDTIVGQRLSSIQQDETIICTVVDDSDKANGHYKVTPNQSVIYDAYAENTKYRAGLQVYVLVPKDGSKKLILSRYLGGAEDKPAPFVAPSKQIAAVGRQLEFAKEEIGLDINGDAITQLIEEQTIEFNTQSLNAICIEAEFKCPLSDCMMQYGNYGLVLELDDQKFVFDSSSMFGNPYGFSVFFKQEIGFTFSAVNTFQTAKLYLYQRGNFMPASGEIPAGAQVSVRNVKIQFGLAMAGQLDDTVKLYTNSSLTYTPLQADTKEKTLSLTWYNKDADTNKYIGFSDGSFNKDKAKTKDADDDGIYYHIEWYVDNLNGSSTLVGESNESDNKTDITITCVDGLVNTDVKAQVWCSGKQFLSNTISFENLAMKTAGPAELGVTIKIINGKNSVDAYPLYGVDNYLIDASNQYSTRTVKFTWDVQQGTASDDFWKNSLIYWYLPNQATMLKESALNSDLIKLDEGHQRYIKGYTGYRLKTIDERISDKEKFTTIEVDVLKTLKEKYPSSEQYKSREEYLESIADYAKDSTEYKFLAEIADIYYGNPYTPATNPNFNYTINNLYNMNFTNNTILCKVDYPLESGGVRTLEAEKTFAFASAGVAGTDYTIAFTIADGSPGFIKGVHGKDNPFKISAQLYNLNGQPVENQLKTQEYTEYPWNNECIWQPEFKNIPWLDSEINIRGQYPIPYLGRKDLYAAIPAVITYDSLGTTASYYSGPMNIYDAQSNQPINNITWNMRYKTKEDAKWLPKLSSSSTNSSPILVVPNLYIPLDKSWVGIEARADDILWYQPLIIQQNKYSSSLLNNWDGSLQVNNEENYILASMIGAGKKDTGNTFTGILMGDVGNQSNKSTGLFGYQEGLQSFGFNTDGTAFIGKAGHGRILFDGDESTIKSADWDETNKGTCLDLDDASLQLVSDEGHLKFINGQLSIKVLGTNLSFGDGTTAEEMKDDIADNTTQIIANATGIETLVERKATFFGKGWKVNDDSLTDKFDRFVVSNSGTTNSYDPIITNSTQLRKGDIIEVQFTDKLDTSEIAQLSIVFQEASNFVRYNIQDSVSWAEGETLVFVCVDDTEQENTKNEDLISGVVQLTTLSKSYIQQTADSIKAYVGDELNKNYSKIEQTVNSIKAEVAANKPTFYGVGWKNTTVSEADRFIVSKTVNKHDPIATGANEEIKVGSIIQVQFATAHSSTSNKPLQLSIVLNEDDGQYRCNVGPSSVSWNAGETLAFVCVESTPDVNTEESYAAVKGTLRLTSVSQAQVTMTANEITAKVSNIGGYSGTLIKTSISDSAYYRFQFTLKKNEFTLRPGMVFALQFNPVSGQENQCKYPMNNTVKEHKLNLADKDNILFAEGITLYDGPECKTNETMYVMYMVDANGTGYFRQTNQASSSQMQMLSDMISARVTDESTGSDFWWSLTSTRFALGGSGSSDNANEDTTDQDLEHPPTFICTKRGVSIAGNISTANGFVSADEENGLSVGSLLSVSNELITLQTENFTTEITNAGDNSVQTAPTYYYRTAKPKIGGIVFRDLETGQVIYQNGKKVKTDTDNTYRLECTSTGTLLKSTPDNIGFPVYKVRYVVNGEEKVKGYVAVKYSGSSVWGSAAKTVNTEGGTQDGDTTVYQGSALNLTNGLLVLSSSDNEQQIIINANASAPITLIKNGKISVTNWPT